MENDPSRHSHRIQISGGVRSFESVDESYFPLMLFIVLNKLVPIFASMDHPKVTIQIAVVEQYVPVVLLDTLCKVVLTFESVDEPS